MPINPTTHRLATAPAAFDAASRRRIGPPGWTVSPLSVGTAALGAKGVTPADAQRDAEDVIRLALDAGLNLFDTAPIYRHGESERVLGRALQTLGVGRDRYLLSGKVGTRTGWRDEQRFAADAIRWSVQTSLEAMGVDHLDILLAHDPRSLEQLATPGHGLETLAALRDEGIARCIGLGCRRHDLLIGAMETGLVDVIISYMDYTLLSQTAAQTVLPEARRRGVSVMLGSPLAFGKLAGGEINPDDQPAFAMQQWARERNLSIRDLALQYTLAADASTVLLGPANGEELAECIASATRPIDADTWRAFGQAFNVPIPDALT